VEGVPDHLGQTNYSEICILVTEYISKLNKIQITCHAFNYVFQILAFQLIDNSATNTQNNLGFSRALPAAHALQLNTQNCAWFGSQISVICCELSGVGALPLVSPTGALDPGGGLLSPRPTVPPTSKSWLCHCKRRIASRGSRDFPRLERR